MRAVYFLGAAFLFVAQVGASEHNFGSLLTKRHLHHRHKKDNVVEKRGTCEFPTNAGLVAVTPDQQNAGWAMSPNQPCKPGMYCPYACPPGQLMQQWNPAATSYVYPLSMDGGLYCNEQGEVSKPFPDKPYCADGVGTFASKNNATQDVAFCQTVLPGNEAMLIPTCVKETAVLAVPDTSYWASTAAHYYINPPGVSTEDGCVWGTNQNPWGNWSPYVAGANVDENGLTFTKLGWNPIYLEPATPFRNQMPDWGVKIECDEPGCNGLPCYIDPDEQNVNEMGGTSSVGAGGATFCVVTVPKGQKANVVVYSKSGATGGYQSNSPAAPSSTSATAVPSSSQASSSTASTSAPAPSSTSSSTLSTSSTASVTSSSSSISSSSISIASVGTSSATNNSIAIEEATPSTTLISSSLVPSATNPPIFVATAATALNSSPTGGASAGNTTALTFTAPTAATQAQQTTSAGSTTSSSLFSAFLCTVIATAALII